MAYKQRSNWSNLTGKGDGEPRPKGAISVDSKYKTGALVDETEFEKLHMKQKGKYPQLDVADYSEVKSDEAGNYVVKLKDGGYAGDLEKTID